MPGWYNVRVCARDYPGPAGFVGLHRLVSQTFPESSDESYRTWFATCTRGESGVLDGLFALERISQEHLYVVESG